MEQFLIEQYMIRNFCEAIFLLKQCKSSKDFDNITQEIERIKEETLQQIKSKKSMMNGVFFWKILHVGHRLFLALFIKFDEITEKLKQQFLELKPKNLDLQNYKNLILSSDSAEEAYIKIAKFAYS